MSGHTVVHTIWGQVLVPARRRVPHAHTDLPQIRCTLIHNHTFGLVGRKILANVLALVLVTEDTQKDHLTRLGEAFARTLTIEHRWT